MTSSEIASATTSKKKAKETEPVPTGTAYSVIGTIPPLAHSVPLASSHPQTAPEPPSPSTKPSAEAASASSSSGGSGHSEWKIIGVAVIAFSAVAAILLLSVFFDHWWRFVRDLFWGRRRRRSTGEELVPDWEKAQWELRGEGRQRYPSFTSLPSMPMVQSGSEPAQQIQSPPQAAIGRTGRSILTQGRGPATQLDGPPFGMKSRASARISGSSSGFAGVGTVGLGLGRVGSVSRSGQLVSPRVGGAEKSPRSQHTHKPMNEDPFDDIHSPTLGRLHEASMRGAVNPFEDAHSPMPADIYGGMAN